MAPTRSAAIGTGTPVHRTGQAGGRDSNGTTDSAVCRASAGVSRNGPRRKRGRNARIDHPRYVFHSALPHSRRQNRNSDDSPCRTPLAGTAIVVGGFSHSVFVHNIQPEKEIEMRLYIAKITPPDQEIRKKSHHDAHTTYEFTKFIKCAWCWDPEEEAQRVSHSLGGIVVNSTSGNRAYCTDFQVEARPQGGFAISCDHPFADEPAVI